MASSSPSVQSWWEPPIQTQRTLCLIMLDSPLSQRSGVLHLPRLTSTQYVPTKKLKTLNRKDYVHNIGNRSPGLLRVKYLKLRSADRAKISDFTIFNFVWINRRVSLTGNWCARRLARCYIDVRTVRRLFFLTKVAE